MSNRTILAAAAAAILSTTSVFAQVPPGNPAPVPPAAPGDFRPAHRMQHRLQVVHDRLGITPAQQPQWDALVATLRDDAMAMRTSPAMRDIRSGRLDAVQELQAAAAIARQRADAMQRTIPPAEALYAVLSPAQRQLADRAVNRMLHRASHRHG